MACEHRGCNCKEEAVNKHDKTFCSEPCAKAELENQHGSSCPCGHPGCGE